MTPSLVVIVGIAQPFVRVKLTEHTGPVHAPDFKIDLRLSNHNGSQPNEVIGLKRRQIAMIATTNNTSTMPCTTAKTGPDGGAGGTLGANACSGGILRKDCTTSTKTLR